ncbi:MAG: hypothetical protein GY754_28855 [bacterium]|nr:hypothetical protein [bacterium]
MPWQRNSKKGHWVASPMERATKDSWQRKDIPASKIPLIILNQSYSQQEYEAIKMGFIPRAMEDKWFIYFEDNKLFLHRSWTGVCHYQVLFKEKTDEKTDLVTIHKAWFNPEDYDQEYAETSGIFYEGKILLYLVDRLLLDKNPPFPIPPHLETAAPTEKMMYRHGFVGYATSNREYEEEQANLEKKKTYESEEDEIIDLFGYSDYLASLEAVEDFAALYGPEFKVPDIHEDEYYSAFKDYTERIDKWLHKNKFTGEITLRYMLAGLLIQFDGMLKFSMPGGFPAVYEEYRNTLTRKFELFEIHYGKKIESFEEYYDLLTYYGDEALTGKKLFNYVTKGKDIDRLVR